jgi:hypothetical protein
MTPTDGQAQGKVCPLCGSPNIGPAPEGIGEELPNGKCDLEVFSPFEVFMDLEGKQWKNVTEILVRRRYDLDVVRRKYGRDDIEPDNNSNIGGTIGLNLLRAIAYAAGNSVYGSGVASGRSLGDDTSVTVDAIWKRPCTEYPEGLVAVYTNEKLINEDQIKDGIPYRNKKGNPLWPWHLARFDYIPGRMLGRTPLDDVAPKQEQRNKLEAYIQLIISRCANPVWLIAKNLGITQITGEPGQVLEGNWQHNPMLKPTREPGENVPTSVIAWLEKIDSDIEEVAGIFEVLKGSAPSGVTAGTALRLLLERAITRFTPVVQDYEIVWEAAIQDLLCIFQQFGTVDRINKIQGLGNTWEIERFSKADINGSIDVIVEAGSSLPKSMVGEQALIQDLINMGVVVPQLPETQYKILERFGSTDLLGDTDLNIKAAQRENWDFLNEEKPFKIDLIIDLHVAHVQIHKQLALKSDYTTWPPEKQKVLVAHILEHMMAMAPPMQNEGDPKQDGKKPAGKEESQSSPETKLDTMEAPMPGGVM